MHRHLLIAVALVLAVAAGAHAETYTIDVAHSSVGFSVRHMMISRVPGVFHEFAGTVNFDPADTSNWSVAVTIQAASIDTRNEQRDTHLKSNDFLAVDSFPTIVFKSTKVIPKGNGKFDVLGNLTLRGVTKPVTLSAELLGELNDPQMGKRIGFAATTRINRLDFGVAWSKVLETGGLMVGADVDIDLGVEAVAK
jgi:polyisoprenoid-binding protein YceI